MNVFLINKIYSRNSFDLFPAQVEWDNVPGEFECAIMGELMQDPVILPSGNRCDRKNIERHILSTPNDPFNRFHSIECQGLISDAL